MKDIMEEPPKWQKNSLELFLYLIFPFMLGNKIFPFLFEVLRLENLISLLETEN